VKLSCIPAAHKADAHTVVVAHHRDSIPKNRSGRYLQQEEWPATQNELIEGRKCFEAALSSFIKDLNVG